jgi:regulator of replication initiation timing
VSEPMSEERLREIRLASERICDRQCSYSDVATIKNGVDHLLSEIERLRAAIKELEFRADVAERERQAEIDAKSLLLVENDELRDRLASLRSAAYDVIEAEREGRFPAPNEWRRLEHWLDVAKRPLEARDD